MNDSIGTMFLSAFDNKLIFLALADTIPAVTVDVRLKGLPTAKTHSPIFTSSLLPIAIG